MYKQIKLKDHPKLKAAHEFVTNYPDAIIAGGVARDLLLDREYSDIDIFVPDPLEKTTAYKLYGAISRISEDQKRRANLSAIGEVVLDIKIMDRDQMISIEGLLEEFEIALNQAWLERTDDGFEVHSTPLFDSLAKHKIFGYYPDLVNQTSDHLQRIYDSFNSEYELLALAYPPLIDDLAIAS
jgi:hypothetical protein